MFQPQATAYSTSLAYEASGIPGLTFHSTELAEPQDGGPPGAAAPAFLCGSFQSSPTSGPAPSRPSQQQLQAHPQQHQPPEQPHPLPGLGTTTTNSAPDSSPMPIGPSYNQHQTQQLVQHRPQNPQTQIKSQPRYSLRSKVSMQGDVQHISDVAAQEAAARDFKGMAQGPLVGEKTPSEAITEEYRKADPVYVTKTVALPQTYSHYRPIRGDGNCGWRAIAFGYLEWLVNSSDGSLISRERARLINLNGWLMQNGYDMNVFIDMLEATLDLLKELAKTVSNPAEAMERLLSAFRDENVDNAIVYHMRLLAGAQLRSNPAEYEAFIAQSGGVENFLKTTIEVPYQEIEEIGIRLLAKILLEPVGLALEIVYLDRTPTAEANVYVFPDGANRQFPTTLCLLFRPDHYDIIYRRPPPEVLPAPPQPTAVQVNHAMEFTKQIQLGPSRDNIPAYDVDMTTVANLMTALNGSITPMPPPLGPVQASPLSEAYSIAPASQWEDMIPSYTGPVAPRPDSTPSVHCLPPPAADPGHPLRFSKYNYRDLMDDCGDAKPQFLTSAFKNSYHNRAHYLNPEFHPEEYNPNEDSDRSAHRKKG